MRKRDYEHELQLSNRKAASKTFIEFNPRERWKAMPDVADGTYFVSDFGRVMRLNGHGVFKQCIYHVFQGKVYVAIEVEGKTVERKIHKRFNVWPGSYLDTILAVGRRTVDMFM